MSDDRRFHRAQRFAAISVWAEHGVLAPRSQLPIEEQFENRVNARATFFFRPLRTSYQPDTQYNSQVSYLLDAFDALPRRPDIAFDSTWKAFEAAMPGNANEKTDQRLCNMALQGYLDESPMWRLLSNVPAQTCEYLFKRLIVSHATSDSARRARGRVTGWSSHTKPATGIFGEVATLLQSMDAKYGRTSDLAQHRRGAMLIRLALRGDTLELPDGLLQLSPRARLHLLLSGAIWTARNERFHGESFSPFVSSAATLKTYTHPHFLFLCSYAALNLVWLRTFGPNLGLSLADVDECIDRNLDEALALYGRHWA